MFMLDSNIKKKESVHFRCTACIYVFLLSSICLPIESFKAFVIHKPSFRIKPHTKDERMKASMNEFLVRNKESVNQDDYSAIFVIDTEKNNKIIPCVDSSIVPPPPSSTSNPDDDFFRDLRQNWPMWIQNKVIRDSGLLRAISDRFLSVVTAAGIVQSHPHLFLQFCDISLRKTKSTSYGSHPYQTIDIIEYPLTSRVNSNGSENLDLVIFVHGGAWGSGRPWMYRLAASAFANNSIESDSKTHVAVIGYRTFPDGDVNDQIQDIDDALTIIESKKKYKHVTIIGHSTGAHISLMMIMKRIKKQIQNIQKNNPVTKFDDVDQVNSGKIGIDTYMGLSGPYDIPSHLEYEKGRGVDEISPLLPACGKTHENLLKSSPAFVWKSIIDEYSNKDDVNYLNKLISIPKIIFVHGTKDNIVPYTATTSIYNELSETSSNIDKNKFVCQALLLKDVGHVDLILDLFLNGPSKHVIIDLLTKSRNSKNHIEKQFS